MAPWYQKEFLATIRVWGYKAQDTNWWRSVWNSRKVWWQRRVWPQTLGWNTGFGMPSLEMISCHSRSSSSQMKEDIMYWPYLTPYMRGGQLERLQLEGCDTWCMEVWCVLQRSSIRFVLVLRCYLNLDHLLACSQHLNMPTLQQLGKVLLLWSMARLNLILSRAIVLIALRIILIESNLGMEMCVGRFCSYWSVSAIEISCETPNCKRGLYWNSRSGWCRDAAGLAKQVLPCCLIFHRNILNLIPLELVDRKPWNVWKALVLVQRNGVPSSNSWPRCLGIENVIFWYFLLSWQRCKGGWCGGTINWQVLLLGDMSFQDFGDCTFGLTTRTGKCVKMVYAL